MPDSSPMVTPAQRKWLPWLTAVGFFMQTLDGTILNTALPSMAEALGESPLQMQSVIIAYMLTVALLIPASGWLADRFGTRRVYLVAILLFTLGSLACAIANTLPMLVIARVLQGVGGALLMPIGRLAVLRVYSKHELLRVMSFVTIPGLLGPLIGPALGGWLVEVASWHWVFLINLPVGLLGFVASWHFMPDLRQHTARFDWQGFVLFSVGMVLVSVGLQGLGEHSISTGWALFAVLFGLAAMASYWLYAATAEQPLFSLALFKTSTFAIGIWGNLFARLGSGAMPFLTPLFLQLGLGFSPSKGLFIHQIALAHHQQIRQRHLFDRLILSGQLLLDMTGIHHGDGAVEAVALGDKALFPQREQHGGRIGQTSGFDDQPFEGFDFALDGLHEKPLQRLHQGALHRAADAAGIEQHHLLVHLLYQMVIQPHGAELVDEHGALPELGLLDPVVEQGGLAAAEKTGQQGHGDAGVLHVCHRVAPPLIGRRMSKRVSCISVMSDPYRLANRSPSQRFSKRPWGSSSRFRARKSCQRGNRAGKS